MTRIKVIVCVERGSITYYSTLLDCDKVYEREYDVGKDYFSAFMDLEKACNRAYSEALWQVMRMYGTGGKLLEAVKGFNVDSRL